MQHLDIISVNIWQMLISLCNLVLLFLLLKKFLYQPVRKVLAERQAAVDEQYRAAEEAKAAAAADQAAWEERMESAKITAQDMIRDAAETADRRGEQIVADARQKAERILQQAETDAALEREKATAGIRQEIVDVSALLAEKMIGREVNAADHRALIDSFINNIGEDA